MVLTPIGFAFANAVVTLSLRLFARWRVEGRQHVPRRGSFLVIANHTHYLDPPLINASLARRRVLFLAKEELLTESRGYRHWCLVRYGLIPIKRGGLNREALRQAAELLATGGAVGVFPEGTRSPTGVLQRAQAGASLVALPTPVPILPVAISGLAGLSVGRTLGRWPRIHVRIGEPFLLPFPPTRDRATVTEASDYMMERVAALLPGPLRGYYGQARGAASREQGQGV